MKHGNAGHGRRHVGRSPLYVRWQNARQRCRNPRHPRYKDWGGRGIEFAAAWDDFAVFREYVMALPNAMRTGYSIDRINNNGNYEPGNVKWSTAPEQRANQRGAKWPFGLTDEERDNELYGAEDYYERRQLEDEAA